ncbi:MAG TPA: TetR/AcrR family transcriptional regulator [Candidatus Angelobacter sp.]|nr:TetR/AcrR family transcriptional regulator [Candidatus Angelobacter sp.]
MSKGEKTRQHIVERAATLFNQRGFEGGTMAHLMEATGLEKGGIYRHFSTKEELAAEAFDFAWQASTEARVHDLDSVANSVDKLKRFVGNFVERRSSVPGGCPLLNTAVDADDGNPLLRERAHKALKQWQDILGSIVKAGLERKEIKSSVEPKKLANLIIGSLEGALMISRLERNRDALCEARMHLESYLEAEVRRQGKQVATRVK